MSNYDAVFLIPWGAQSDVLAAVLQEKNGRWLIVADERTDITPFQHIKNIEIVSSDFFIEHSEKYLLAKWMPVTEVGAYCALRTGLYERAEFLFTSSLLETVTKLQTQDALNRAGIPCVRKEILREKGAALTIKFPCIVKPNYGFASLFTKVVASLEEAEAHASDYKNSVKNTPINIYLKKYIEHLGLPHIDDILLEPDLTSWKFLSVSVVVKNNSVVCVLPIVGLQNSPSEYAHFQWRRAMAGMDLPSGIKVKLEEISTRFVEYFSIKAGVFSFEALADFQTGDINVLEIEARTMGSWVTMLIQHSHGINLEEVSFRLFLDLDTSVSLSLPRKALAVRQAKDHSTDDLVGRFPIMQREFLSGDVLVKDMIFDVNQ